MNLLRRDEDDTPVAVSGPVLLTGRGLLENTLVTIMSQVRALQGSLSTEVGRSGPVIGLHLKNLNNLWAILNMEHFWPGEDTAMMHEVRSLGGRIYQPLSPAMFAISPMPEAVPNIRTRILGGRLESRRTVLAHYTSHSAPGSVPYGFKK